MNVLLVDNGTSYLPRLKTLLDEHTVTVVSFEALTLHSFAKYDLAILSGGHKYTVMSHRRKYAQELRLIQDSKTPIIGICLGFELIIVAFGGVLKLLRRKVHSTIPIRFTHNDETKGDRSEYQVFESRRRGVKKMPADLVALAKSRYGIEIIRHQKRPIYAFQFHPEMSNEDGRDLIRSAIKAVVKF